MQKIINLNRRERLVVFAGVAFVVLFLFFQLVIQPVFEKRELLAQRLESRQKALTQMLEMAGSFQTLQSNVLQAKGIYASRPQGFTLFSFMDRVAGETRIKKNITYMKPTSTTDETTGVKISYVELKFQDVTMEDLAAYLFKVETSENMVRVNRLSVSKAGETDGLLSVVMQAEAVET
jgi:general secretion pathway protein M